MGSGNEIVTKFEAAKTGSGVGFLRLTAVCLWGRPEPNLESMETSMDIDGVAICHEII